MSDWSLNIDAFFPVPIFHIVFFQRDVTRPIVKCVEMLSTAIPDHGVCDSPEQFASRYAEHKGIVGFLCIERIHEPPTFGPWSLKLEYSFKTEQAENEWKELVYQAGKIGKGWRWHKWGQYIGQHKLDGLEFLSDANGEEGRPRIDEQWLFEKDNPAKLQKFQGFHNKPIFCAIDKGRVWTLPIGSDHVGQLTLSMATLTSLESTMMDMIDCKPVEEKNPDKRESLQTLVFNYRQDLAKWKRALRFDADPIMPWYSSRYLFPDMPNVQHAVEVFCNLTWELIPDQVPFGSKIWRSLGVAPPCPVCQHHERDATIRVNIVDSFYTVCTEKEREWLVCWNRRRIWKRCLFDLNSFLEVLVQLHGIPLSLWRVVFVYAGMGDWPRDWFLLPF